MSPSLGRSEGWRSASSWRIFFPCQQWCLDHLLCRSEFWWRSTAVSSAFAESNALDVDFEGLNNAAEAADHGITEGGTDPGWLPSWLEVDAQHDSREGVGDLFPGPAGNFERHFHIWHIWQWPKVSCISWGLTQISRFSCISLVCGQFSALEYPGGFETPLSSTVEVPTTGASAARFQGHRWVAGFHSTGAPVARAAAGRRGAWAGLLFVRLLLPAPRGGGWGWKDGFIRPWADAFWCILWR